MSPTAPESSFARLDALSGLPRDGGEPVFAAPWQAQAFALAVKLSELGYFTWAEWASALAEQIRSGPVDATLDAGAQYYRHWLDALEALVMAKGLCAASALAQRKAAWADAYRHTPHGQPVELSR